MFVAGARWGANRSRGAENRWSGTRWTRHNGSRPPVRRPEPAMTWSTRPETPADVAAVHALNAAAFPTPAEADLVDRPRADPGAWLDGLSYVSCDADGRPAGYALLTRCHIGGTPALYLAPCAVRPDRQRGGRGPGRDPGRPHGRRGGRREAPGGPRARLVPPALRLHARLRARHPARHRRPRRLPQGPEPRPGGPASRGHGPLRGGVRHL
ncbi:LOW QUALITY PROTEIN: acetyltransferase, partial [Streptomyces sp. SPB78]